MQGASAPCTFNPKLNYILENTMDDLDLSTMDDFDSTDALEHLEWEREQALRDCDNCGFVLIDRVECDFCGERVHD